MSLELTAHTAAVRLAAGGHADEAEAVMEALNEANEPLMQALLNSYRDLLDECPDESDIDWPAR